MALHWKTFHRDRREGSRRIDLTPSGVVESDAIELDQKTKGDSGGEQLVVP